MVGHLLGSSKGRRDPGDRQDKEFRISRNVSQMRALLIFGLAIVYLVSLFVKSAIVDDLALALMLGVTALCLVAVTGSARVISYIAFALSIGLLVGYRAPLGVWEQGLEDNLYLVVLFSLVPLLRIPIRHGGYFEALRTVFERFVHSRGRFYLFVSLVSAFFGSIVNLAIVPLVYEVARASVFSRDKRLLSAAMTRGFTTATIWAPTMASIALIMQLTGAKWMHFFPVGISCGVLTGLVGFAVTMAESRKRTPMTEGAPAPTRPRLGTDALHIGSPAAAMPATTNLAATSAGIATPAAGEPGIMTLAPQAPGDQGAYRKFGQLCIFALILMISIALISYVSGVHTITVVSVAALVYPVLWMAILGRLPALYREFRNSYLPQTLPNLSSEVTLFAAAGMFATALTFSGLGKYVPRALTGLVGGNILLLTIAMIVLSVVLGAAGVHPIVTVAVFGGTMRAASLGVTPTYLAMVLAICWAVGLTVSPSSATIIATASLAKESPVRVGTRWNGLYALVSAATLIVFVTILRLAGIL